MSDYLPPLVGNPTRFVLHIDMRNFASWRNKGLPAHAKANLLCFQQSVRPPVPTEAQLTLVNVTTYVWLKIIFSLHNWMKIAHIKPQNRVST